MPTLNLNYNINLTGGKGKRRVPRYQAQYIVVGGGGGAAGGGSLKAGQAGSGGQVLQAGYCFEPYTNYPVTIGSGGNGGAVSGSLAITTGSVGETSSLGAVIALGGNGGVYQSAVTLSFFGGAGNNGVYPPSDGNGGSGSQWNYNLGGGPLCYPPFGYCGEYITSSYYSGGGAGFIVGPPVIEYLIVGAGGGGGAKQFIATTQDDGHGGGGWGGEVSLGTITAYPNEEYRILIGSGGLNATNYGSPSGTGSIGNLSSISGSNTINPHYITASGGSGGSFDTIGGGVGGGAIPYTSSASVNGANGYQWVDGFYYGGGGGASGENPQVPNGLGGFGGGSNGGGSTTTGSVGGNDVTNYPFGVLSGPPGTDGQVQRSAYGYGMGAGGSGLRQLQNSGNGAGGNGTVALRYLGAPIAIGGEIITSGSYTYHYFASSSNFTLTLDPLLIRPGLPGESGAVTSSNALPNTGGGAGGAFYNESGSKGGSGFVAFRYEGLIVSASGGQMINTDHYTYHIFTASGNFYSGEGNTQNPNINPCA